MGTDKAMPASIGEYIVGNVFSNVLRRGYLKDEYEFHSNRIDSGEISPVQFFYELVECPEFVALGVENNSENWVRLMCRIFLNRPAGDPDVEHHAPRIDGGMDRRELAQEFSTCEEAHTAFNAKRESGQLGDYMKWEGNNNGYFLQNLFHGVLARGPGEDEFNHHLGRL